MKAPSRRFLSQILRIAVVLVIFLRLLYEWHQVPVTLAGFELAEEERPFEDTRTGNPGNSLKTTSTDSAAIIAITSPPSRPPSSLQLDKIFVINVQERTDRRRLLEAQMEYHGVPVDFVPAQTPDSNQTRRLLQDRDLPERFRSPYGQRVLSIFASHLHIFQEEILRHKYQATLILEDDVDVDMGWREEWPDLFRELQDSQGKDGWDLLLLGHCVMKHSKPLPSSPSGRWHTTQEAYCAHVYVVSERLVRSFLDQFTTPREAFDIDFHQFCFNDQGALTCKAFVLVPPMFVQIPRDEDNPTVNGGQNLPTQHLQRSTLKHLGLSIRDFQN